jgi:hypothetical protein
VATGPEVKPGPLAETVELIDLGPTALAALGVPSAVPRDGKVLASLAGADAHLEVGAASVDSSKGTSESGLESHEEEEIEEHLRGLGYVE